VGAAWLSTAAREGSTIVTAELDPHLARSVADLFRDDDRVQVIPGDWTALCDSAPFSLLFLDVPDAKRSGVEVVAELLEPGGVVVLDDFTPSSCWPPLYEGRVDTVREQWLVDPRFTTVEVMVAEDASVLIAAKR
jgi:predicted O-methyltransferase YrrM